VSITFWLLVVFYALTAWILVARIGCNLSLSSITLILMLIFHGPAYLYYTRVYGPNTDFFEGLISTARGNDVITRMDLALALTLLMICAGIFLIDLIMSIGRRRWRNAVIDWARTPIVVRPSEVSRAQYTGWALILVILVPFLFLDAQVSKALTYFTADLMEFEKIELRREGGGSSFYLYNLLLSNLMPFLSFVFIVYLLARAQISKVLVFSYISLVAIGKAATLSKAPLAIFIIQCVSIILLCRNLNFSYKSVLIFAVLVIGLFGFMSWIANPSADEVLIILQFLFYRAFMIVNESLLEYFSAIPLVLDHSWGVTVGWIATLAGEDRRLPAYWLVAEIHRGFAGSTTTAMFMGDAWADFGWWGVVLFSLALGLLIRWIDLQLIVKRGKTAWTLGGLALGHYGMFVALSTSFQTTLFTGGLALVIPLVYVFEHGSIHRGVQGEMRKRPAGCAAKSALK
jgi:hypothetical protein